MKKINTEIYKAVYRLAEELMKAANRNDQKAFDKLYAELHALCVDNENTDKDHPEQWETLADFMEDTNEAIAGYEVALEKATAINSKDHMSSIAHSMATLQLELGDKESAIKNLEAAKISANKIADKEFKIEINDLLETLTGEDKKPKWNKPQG